MNNEIDEILQRISDVGGYIEAETIEKITSWTEGNTQRIEYVISKCKEFIAKNKNNRQYPWILADFYHIRGLMYGLQQEFDLAIADFTGAINAYSSDAPMFERGKVYYQQKEFDKALKDINAAISNSLNKNNGDYYYYRGLIYKSLGRNNEATHDFQIALKMANR